MRRSSLVALVPQPPTEELHDPVNFPCAHRACVGTQSDEFYPYCSQTCLVRGSWDSIAAIQRNVERLLTPLEQLRHLDSILDTCPFRPEAKTFQDSIREVCTAIVVAQRTLTKTSVDFNHQATYFTDILPELIAAHEGQNPGSMWMISPADWDASQDTRWLRGAMSGAYIPQWLSYHVSHAETGLILIVYRSTWLRDSDEIYGPVAKLLGDGYKVLFSEVRQDENMMFGHGEMTIYALDEP